MVETLQSHCVKNGRNRVDHIGGNGQKVIGQKMGKKRGCDVDFRQISHYYR